jgi:hypothetical protein
MHALNHIKKYVDCIDSPHLYIETTIYSNICEIVSAASSAFRFYEQKLSIDFNPTTYGVHMQVRELPNSEYRFK